jgi:hypothetical protein
MKAELKAIGTLVGFSFAVYSVIQSLPKVEQAWRRLTR